MAKNPDNKHSLTGIINKVEDDGRIEQFFQDQFLSIVNPSSCVHPKITAKHLSFNIDSVIEAVSTLSSKTKFNVIRYVSHIIYGFP